MSRKSYLHSRSLPCCSITAAAESLFCGRSNPTKFSPEIVKIVVNLLEPGHNHPLYLIEFFTMSIMLGFFSPTSS